MHKMVKFYLNKGNDKLKFGCISPNLANNWLHSSTSAKFCPFTKSDKNLLSKVQKDMVGGPSEVFTRKAVVVVETHICKSTNVCRSVVGKDASQLYLYSICQPMTKRLYARYEFDADLQRFKPRQKKSRKFEYMFMSHFQWMKPDRKIERFYATRTQKKINSLNADGFYGQWNTMFEAVGGF